MYHNDYSFIINSFYGQFYQKISCGSCKYNIQTFEPFCILQLSIDDKYTSIYESLHDFVKSEILKMRKNGYVIGVKIIYMQLNK